MKILSFFLFVWVMVTLPGCSSKELSRDKAFDLLKKEFPYPSVNGSYIFTHDPASIQTVKATDLESKGYIIIQSNQRLIDASNPIITFTEKSKEFLLPQDEKDKSFHAQRVRTSDIELVAVTGIKMLNEGKKAIVEYTTEVKNLTPFAVLAKELSAGKVNNQTAYFSLYDDGWRLEKKPGLDFLGQ